MRRVSVERSRTFQAAPSAQYDCKNLGTGVTNTKYKKYIDKNTNSEQNSNIGVG